MVGFARAAWAWARGVASAALALGAVPSNPAQVVASAVMTASVPGIFLGNMLILVGWGGCRTEAHDHEPSPRPAQRASHASTRGGSHPITRHPTAGQTCGHSSARLRYDRVRALGELVQAALRVPW